MQPAKVYVGYDPREDWAYRVACASILRHATIPVSITPLKLGQLELAGLIRRPRRMVPAGYSPNTYQQPDPAKPVHAVMWDEISQAPMSTEFAISRFLTPLLAQTGWAAFLDSDTVALADIAELFRLADDERAVMCVQQQHGSRQRSKMDGQPQTSYVRKNWSSVMLFNCDHPANRGLDLALINTAPGRDLHRFCWLDDRWIGELPPEWNWLVGVNARPPRVKLAHFTLGGPWLPGWVPHEHDDLWLAASEGIRA